MILGVDRDDPALVTSLIAAIVADALHDRGAGPPDATIVIESNLSFTISDTDASRPAGIDGRPSLALYDTLLDRRRWPLAAAAALATHTQVEVIHAGVLWRQEFKWLEPSTPERIATRRPDGTRITYELDCGYFADTAALPSETLALLPCWAHAAHIPDTRRLSFIDLRGVADSRGGHDRG